MLKPQEWEFVLDSMSSGSTIICFGAELFARPGQSLEDQIVAELQDVENARIYNDGLFHFQGTGDATTHTKIKRFYNRDFPEVNAVLEQLAGLPVQLFLCTNPDNQLQKAFNRLGRPCQYGFHHANQPALELTEPTVDRPLIYNLLGDIRHRESLVLTHEDLFAFLESLMEGKSVSPLVKSHINSANNFMFIGLPFDRWYMKVLLHFLQKDTNRRALKYAANLAFDQDVQSFMVDEFKITCVPTRIAAFVDELCSRWKNSGLQCAEAPAQPAALFDKWTALVLKDELDLLLDEMVQGMHAYFGQNAESQNELFNLSGRLARLEKMVSRATIAPHDAQLQRNQIRDALVQFLHDVVKPLAI